MLGKAAVRLMTSLTNRPCGAGCRAAEMGIFHTVGRVAVKTFHLVVLFARFHVFPVFKLMRTLDAALAADGISEITGTEIIERGYYNIVGKFKELGADISNDPSEISTANIK